MTHSLCLNLPIAFKFTFFGPFPTDAVYAQFPTEYIMDGTGGFIHSMYTWQVILYCN